MVGSPKPLRFRVRSLLLAMIPVAALLWLGVRVGLLPVVACITSGALLAWSIRSRRRGWLRPARLAAGATGVVLLWFGSVDELSTRTECPACSWYEDRYQLRLLGVPVLSTSLIDRSTAFRALIDLGHPCPHTQMEPFVLCRTWGTLVDENSCYVCYVSLSGEDDRYTPRVAIRLRQLAERDPSRAREVFRRVAVEQDRRWFNDAFMTDIFVDVAISDGCAWDAAEWIKASTPERIRIVDGLTRSESKRVVDDLIALGVSPLVVWVRQCDSFEPREESGSLVIPLPADKEVRSDVVQFAATLPWGYGQLERSRDYGQAYLRP